MLKFFYILFFLFFYFKTNLLFSHNLVDISKVDPTIKINLIYATKNNHLKKKIYSTKKAYLSKEVAIALSKVQKNLLKKNLSLIIYDAYRPLKITKLFWDAANSTQKNYFANPENGSTHNKGFAVDVSILNLKTNKELKMPCKVDSFSKKAFTYNNSCSKEERINRNLLIYEMSKHNFNVIENEWWHFEYNDHEKQESLNIPFSDL